MTMRDRIDKRAAARLARASILLVLSVSYLSSIFQITHDAFWTGGLGDWMDPYFINFLLEHWHHSVWSFADPSSPPMFFPARGTLGYSHGLILYAPFYLAVRPFLHPFQAYSLSLFLVLEIGILCLYLVFRRILGLSFVESLLLSAFFLSSRNVTGGSLGVWSQRASVFLIPPILLILLVSLRMRPGRPRMMLAGLSGLLAALLFTQDFYTAHFALFFAILGLIPALVVGRDPSVVERVASFWKEERSVRARAALVTAALAAAWMISVRVLGGGSVRILGVRIASHDWRRPAVVGLAALVAFVWVRGGIRDSTVVRRARPWLLPFAMGGLAGALVFLWIYLGAYREHPAFPLDQTMNSLIERDPSRWRSPADVVRDFRAYDTLRSFALVSALAVLAWVPWFRIDRKARLYGLWVLFVSLVVLAIPLRFNGFSIWTAVFAPLPGFSVIRDPTRIIYLYELAAVLSTALLVMRLPRRSVPRISIVLLLAALLVAEPNQLVFDFLRPNAAYDQWVEAPIDIDASCRSFFIKAASDRYMARSNDKWTLYAIDSMFVSLRHSIPTLNGYSAWSPEGWALTVPTEPGYPDAVRRWIDRHTLRGVCEFDIERRTMRPFTAAAR